jgi:putative two-component system response regulator
MTTPTSVRGRVLVVDDQPANRAVLRRLIERDGHQVITAADGVEALTAVEQHRPDLLLLDVVMPRLGGVDVCRVLKSDGRTRLIPVVLVTALEERASRLAGFEAGADDFLSKPVDATELRTRTRSLIAMKQYTDELEAAEAIVLGLASAIEARDPCTSGHAHRLGEYATLIGRRLVLDESSLNVLRRGALLHDVGKVAVPDDILRKPGPLSPDELAVMRQHTIVGDSMCAPLKSLAQVRPIVRSHHELRDGSGYPDHLVGDAIPLLAQIIGIVDVFDAMTSDRPYRRGWSVEAACEVLRAEAAAGLRRSDLVEALIDTVANRPVTQLPPELPRTMCA